MASGMDKWKRQQAARKANNYEAGAIPDMLTGMDNPKKSFDEGAAKALIKNQVSKPRVKTPTGLPSTALDERTKYAK